MCFKALKVDLDLWPYNFLVDISKTIVLTEIVNSEKRWGGFDLSVRGITCVRTFHYILRLLEHVFYITKGKTSQLFKNNWHFNCFCYSYTWQNPWVRAVNLNSIDINYHAARFWVSLVTFETYFSISAIIYYSSKRVRLGT